MTTFIKMKHSGSDLMLVVCGIHAVLGFLLRLIDVSLWVITLGPIKTLMLALKAAPKVALANACVHLLLPCTAVLAH
jgi:hypothetical protein